VTPKVAIDRGTNLHIAIPPKQATPEGRLAIMP